MKANYAEFVLQHKIWREMCSTKCVHKILGTKLTVHKIFSTKFASENMLHNIGFEHYRIFAPLSRVRILIPCLDWNKIMLPGQLPLTHE